MVKIYQGTVLEVELILVTHFSLKEGFKMHRMVKYLSFLFFFPMNCL